jgi:hypothetical protein
MQLSAYTKVCECAAAYQTNVLSSGSAGNTGLGPGRLPARTVFSTTIKALHLDSNVTCKRLFNGFTFPVPFDSGRAASEGGAISP